MSNHLPIVDRLLDGTEYDLKAIDDEIDRWHESNSALPLHEWLGFTEEEYAIFVEKPRLVRALLGGRRYGLSPKQLAQATDRVALAARGASPSEVEELRQWLTATGRL